MMETVPQVTSGLGLRKFQADGFLLTRVYIQYCTNPHYNGSSTNYINNIKQYYSHCCTLFICTQTSQLC